MRIEVQENRQWPAVKNPKSLVLVPDSWNDHHYITLYDLWWRDGQNEIIKVGQIKVGRANLAIGRRPFPAGVYAKALPEDCFSLGQGEEFYTSLREIMGDAREEALISLRDIAYDPALLQAATEHDVTTTSLLRSYSLRSVRTQFHRIAKGGKTLKRFHFAYRYAPRPEPYPAPTLEFEVEPESNPPTNVHVIIGRNGSGKTTLLGNIVKSLTAPQRVHGIFFDRGDRSEQLFVNLVSVAWSAFDPFDPPAVDDDTSPNVFYHYVGLKKSASEEANRGPFNAEDLGDQFTQSLKEVGAAGRGGRWLSAVALLENDPNFAEYSVSEALVPPGSERETDILRHEVDRTFAFALFGKMSSGHRIVLLTVTKLVELVAERTLVLIDEPESHLHPPLLSAFVRVLSELLTERNGVAVVATHSPVLLQEVPRSCVSVLRRNGDFLTVERPEEETFAEGIGVLTHLVFDLEVSGSGFHREIARQVAERHTYDEVIAAFDGQLGGEGRALVRVMLNSRAREQR
ncbi:MULTISPECIES: ATP-binding protein [unclassified Rhodococcus (in: high G+C Gram-positive bacteria)]|uniref:ATP-binding protein n=1 Tax=unclassified Rhodococcus (in: high G+C Gram-positive bacteria) TaxID=192944 RepID=UPI0009E6DBBD|nr:MULTISPECIES: ATP-binding protein [unclassified Rhodococcus (in: high G+C Gram-positive bacteria)]